MLNLISLSTTPDILAKEGHMPGHGAASNPGFHAVLASQQQAAEVPPRAAYPFTPQQVLANNAFASTELPQEIEHIGRGSSQPPEVIITPVPDGHVGQDDANGRPDLDALAAALERIATSQALAVAQNPTRENTASGTQTSEQSTATRQQGNLQTLMSAQSAQPAQPLVQPGAAQPVVSSEAQALINQSNPQQAASLRAMAADSMLTSQNQNQLATLIKGNMQVQPDSNARLSTEAARAQSLQPQIVAQNAAGQQPVPVFAGLNSQATEMAPSVASQWLQDMQQATTSGVNQNIGSGMNVQPNAQEQMSLQGMSTTSAQPTAASSPSISSPLASSGWQQQLGQQVLNMHLTQDQTVKLRLHPAELGPLMISMKMEEQAASMQFSSNNAQVRAAVEQAIPQLREILTEQGIALGETGVNDGKKEQESQEMTELSHKSADTLIEDKPAEPEAIDIQLRNGQIDLYA